MLQKSYKLLLLSALCSVFVTTSIIYEKDTIILFKPHFFIIATCILVISVGIIDILFKDGNLKYHINKTDLWLIALLVYIVLCVLFSSTGYNESLLIYIGLITFYFVLKRMVFFDKNFFLPTLVLVFLFSGLCQALIGGLQVMGFAKSFNDYFKVTGLFNNPGPYAIFLATILPLALSAFIYYSNSKKSSVLKYLSMITCISIVVILPFTFSRTGLLASLTGVVVVLYYQTSLFSRIAGLLKIFPKKVILIVALAGLITILGIALSYKPGSTMGRMLIWKISLTAFIDEPIFGYGIGSFERIYNEAQSNYFSEQTRPENEIFAAGKISYAFNDFVHIAVELGVVGLIIFVGILSTYFRPRFFKKEILQSNYLIAGSIASLISLFVSCLFSYPLQQLPICLNWIFLTAIISVEFPNREILIPGQKRKIVNFFCLILMLLCICIIFYQFKIYNAKQRWVAGKAYIEKGDNDKALSLFEEIYPMLNYHGSMLLDYGLTSLLSGDYNRSVAILEQSRALTSDPFLYSNLAEAYQKLKKYEMAEKMYLRSINMIPYRLYPRYLLAMMYVEKGDIDSATRCADEALKIKIKVNSALTNEIRILLKDLLVNRKTNNN